MEIENPFRAIKERQRSAPVDVDALARDLGVKVYYTSLEPDVYGKLKLDRERGGSSGYAIYVNRGDATVSSVSR